MLTISGCAFDCTKWDGLYVGRGKGVDFIKSCKLDHGFDKVSAANLQKRLKPLIKDPALCQAHRPQGHLG
jgi:bifunctional non-homologous end joining protein LigD